MSSEVGDELLDAGLVTQEQLSACAGPISRSGIALVAALIDTGLRPGALAGFYVASGFGPWVSPRELAEADPSCRAGIPGVFCREHMALPLCRDKNGVMVAMVTPADSQVLGSVARLLGCPVVPRAARLDDLLAGLEAAFPNDDVGLKEDSGVIDLVQMQRDHESQTAASRNPAPASVSHDAPIPLVQKRTYSKPPKADTSDLDDALAAATGQNVTATSADPIVLDEESYRMEAHRACAAAAALGRTALVIRLRRGTMKGLYGLGPDLSADSVADFWVPMASPSLLRRVLRDQTAYFGRYGESPADQLLRRVMRSGGKELFVAPIFVAQKAVALLCVDAPSLETDDRQSLAAVAQGLGAQFASLMQR